MVNVKVDPHIDLSTGYRQDHKCPVAEFIVPCNASPVGSDIHKTKLLQKSWFNSSNLQDPKLVSDFEYALWFFRSSDPENVDTHLHELREYIKSCAVFYFGPPVQTPLKGWIFARTWRIVECMVPLRRLNDNVRSMKRLIFLKVFVCASD